MSLYRVAALAQHNLLLRLRDPGQFLSYLVMPMVLMLVLKPVYERAIPGGATQVATGLLISTVSCFSSRPSCCCTP